MRTLDRYLLSNFLVTFVLAILVLTFVMTIGLFFGLMKYIARGMSALAMIKVLLQSMPGTLSYSVPIAALVSSLLVFSRLSSDSEISAMRSLGVSLRRIMLAPVLLAVFLALCCLHINNSIAPEASYSRSSWKKTFRMSDVTAIIEPGVWVNVGEYSVYVEDREGDRLKDLRVTQPMSNGKLREIRANSAILTTNETGHTQLNLFNVTIDPIREDQPGSMRADTWNLPLSALSGKEEKSAEARQAENKKHTRRIKDKHTWELLRDIIVSHYYPLDPTKESNFEKRKNLSRARTEVATRITLALACLCFVLVGIPMGIQSHRRESSVGLGISLAVAGAFYLFCLTGESLAKNPDIQAQWIVYIPIPVCLVLSSVVVKKKD